MKKINIKRIDEILYYDQIDNGLPVYMLVNNEVNNFYMTFTARYGSVHTEFKIGNKKYKVPNGVAHFLEHVNFNEEEGSTAHDYFNKLGSEINAFTTFDFTSYEVTSNTNFKENLNHLLDYVQTPIFTDELVNKEKGIICEEVKMGKNNPGHKLYYGSNRALYKKDKRRNLVTGEIKDVKNTTKEDLELVYNTFYHPENMFLIITGNFNPEEAITIIKENQSKKKFNKYKFPVILQEKEPTSINNSYKEIEANVEIPKCKISYKMPLDLFKDYDLNHINIYTAILLTSNFGNTSLLREELLEKNLITYLGTSRDTTNDLLTISITFESKTPDKVIPIIKDKLNNLSIDKDELRRKAKAKIANLINNYDDIEYVNTDIMDQLIYHHKIIDNYYEIYDTLDIEELNNYIKLLDFSKPSIVELIPYKKEL